MLLKQNANFSSFFKMMLKLSKMIFKASEKCINSPWLLGNLGLERLKSTKSQISNLSQFYNLVSLYISSLIITSSLSTPGDSGSSLVGFLITSQIFLL